MIFENARGNNIIKLIFILGEGVWHPKSRLQRIQTRDFIIRSHSIKRRSSWGKIVPRTNNVVLDWGYDAVVIHHSGNQGYKAPHEIEKLHMNTRNYDDVGYHYMIHPNGTIYEGREIVYKGAHVRQANSGKIGILMMGDYDHQWWDLDDTLLKKHIATLKDIIKTLKKTFCLKTLGGHKEFLPAQNYRCPGSELMQIMNSLRKELSLNAP